MIGTLVDDFIDCFTRWQAVFSYFGQTGSGSARLCGGMFGCLINKSKSFIFLWHHCLCYKNLFNTLRLQTSVMSLPPQAPAKPTGVPLSFLLLSSLTQAVSQHQPILRCSGSTRRQTNERVCFFSELQATHLGERRRNRLFPTREGASRAEDRRQPIQARWALTDKKPNRFGLVWMWPLVFLFSTRKCVAGCWERGVGGWGGTVQPGRLDEGQITVLLPKICRNFRIHSLRLFRMMRLRFYDKDGCCFLV